MKSKNSGVNEITCSVFDMYCLLFLCEHHHIIAEMFTVFIKTLDAAIPVLLFDERFPFMRSLKVGFVDVSRSHSKYIWTACSYVFNLMLALLIESHKSCPI